MTHTAELRASRPDVSRRRDARADILEAVYGPSLEPARRGGSPFGLRDSANRAPWHERLAVLRECWRDAEWPGWKLAIVLVDAGATFEEIE